MKLTLSVKPLSDIEDELWYFYGKHAFICAEGIDKTFDIDSSEGKYELEFSDTPKSLTSKIVGIRRNDNYNMQWNWGNGWTSSMATYLRRYLKDLLNIGETRLLCVSLTKV